MGETTPRVLVVGAGAAGSAAAAELARAGGVDVVVVGAEPRMPYNRTTVNKGLLSGAVTDVDIALPGLPDVPVRWLLGRRVTALDATGRGVRLDSGETVTADAVILATGAHPRTLPASVDPSIADRVISLRTVEDTHRLRDLLAAGTTPPSAAQHRSGIRHVVIAGGGLIGTETAGLLRRAGHRVTLTDPAVLPMAGHVGETIAAWIRSAHHQAGVHTVCTRIRAVHPATVPGTDRMAVSFDDGDSVDADAVLVSLGVRPATGWLRQADLPWHHTPGRAGQDPATAAAHNDTGAVLVDAAHRVPGHPRLYAAGDLAAVPGPHGQPVVIEHWGAASGQGRTAAATALADLGLAGPAALDPAAPALGPSDSGDAAQLERVPSYSTYVHATKLTIVGWPRLAVTEHPVLGRPGDPRFAVALLDTDHRVVAAVGVGGARAVNQLRPLIARRAPAVDLPAPTGATVP